MQKSLKTSARYAPENYFTRVAFLLTRIHSTHASGRLSLCNNERSGLAHLYFKEAQLIHVTGSKRDAEAVLNDILTWTKGYVRFDKDTTVDHGNVTWRHVEIFIHWLLLLEMHAVVHGVPRNRVEGLAQRLTMRLPRRPIAMPEVVARYGERRTLVQQLHASTPRRVEHTSADGRHKHAASLPQSPIQQVGVAVQQASVATQEWTKRATRVTQEGARQAIEVAQYTARQAILRAQAVTRQAMAQTQETSSSAEEGH